ncbi:MAG TPA: hypothetical protein PKN32_10305 [Bacteroidales bacterium]|nr:hypothetical protein [Bacteroidales bacterium]
MKRILIHIIISIFLLSCLETFSQNRNYLYGGLQMSNFKDMMPFGHIIDDFNDFHETTDITTAHKLCLPMYIPGYIFGFKIHSRFSEFGGNIYFNNFTTLAQGKDSNGIDYYKNLIVTYNGFNLYYRVLIVNTNFFRTGPGISFKIEQFKAKIDFDQEELFNSVVPTSKALIAGQINYTISVGGPKFNFDIGVFYQLPFWQIELDLLNNQLNEGYAGIYTDGQLNFNPASYGITFTIGLGSRENYDF